MRAPANPASCADANRCNPTQTDTHKARCSAQVYPVTGAKSLGIRTCSEVRAILLSSRLLVYPGARLRFCPIQSDSIYSKWE